MKEVFQPITLKNMTVKNRIVRSATNTHMGNSDGTISESEIRILSELAENEVGLIITGNFDVSGENSKVSIDQPSLSSDKVIPYLSTAVNKIKKNGCKLVVQISHAGGLTYASHPVAPSNREYRPGKFARFLTQEEIEQIKADFIASAYRAKRAGFDGVQVHCAHDYLLGEFLSPIYNQRTDQFGGNIDNRFRLVKEIITGIKEKCRDDFPVFIKINSNTEEDTAIYENDLLYMMNEFKLLQVDALEFSGCDFIKKGKKNKNYYLNTARKIRRLIDLPIILVGGIRSIKDMETVLEEGIDMVSLSRPLICEPDLFPKLRAGQEKAQCISCNCCFTLPKTLGKRCTLHKCNDTADSNIAGA